MTRDPDSVFEQISRAVADGEPVDWAALSEGADPETRKLIEQLRVLSNVARLHRDTLPDPGAPVPPPPPPMAPGDVWGHLTLRGELGRGARGHVYRAWDPQLDREVALKLTSDTDDDRLGKDVISEARLLARVRHPHVATIFGAERRQGLVGLWMELVEGETLEATLMRVGRFNSREAALIGLDVCSALAAVHAAGLLHRDIKAQNVMRDRNGRLVLMDFGTGRDAVPSAGAFTHDEVGTPLYMAPELFMGGKASVESDIYSVGVLLYRLVTGSVPIEAHSPSSLKAAHMARTRKPLSDVRSDLPLAFTRVVERALSPDPADRYPSAGAFGMALSSVLVPMEPGRRSRFRWPWALAAGVLLGGGVAAATAYAWAGYTKPVPPAEVRFSLTPASALDEVETVALSPDGTRVAYTSAGRLHLRRMNDVASVEFDQTQGAHDPFWSPDGQWIAFFKGVSVWKVHVAGGDPQLVAPARRPSGGSWSADGLLLYSVELGTSLVTVPASGGTPRVVRAQRPGVRTSLWWPLFVGDGKSFVYSAQSGRTGRRMLYIARIGDGVLAVDRELLENDSNPLVSGDRLFFTSAGQLHGQRLDVANGRLFGDVVHVADGIRVDPYGLGAAEVSVSAPPRVGGRGATRGTVAFVGNAPAPRTMRLIDATGRSLQEFGAGDTRDMRLSPDGRQVAYEQIDPETFTRDIWVLDLARQSRVRLTYHEAEDITPMWSPDGSKVYFLSRRNMRYTLFATGAQGGQREQGLFTFDGPVVPQDVTPDGRSLVYQQLDQQGGWDIYLRPLDGSAPTPLIQSSQNDQDPAISPDGRHLAYSSPESGGRQIWVMPIPADGRRWKVSSDYGREPSWSPDGRTIFYHGLNKTLMQVKLEWQGAGQKPVVGPPSALFVIPFRGYDLRYHYNVLPDLKRFLVATPASSTPSHTATVILNANMP
ncbi:MAG TPA: protein kinase [Luteitalea sp.]|nr:protein kinase [Luteitalea sp.]